ncbi:MAG TPA: hypothetical protein VIU38_00560 [Anaerolineales bacterium]
MNDKSQGHNSDKGRGQDGGHGKPEHDRGSGKSDYRDKIRENRGQGSGGGDFQQMGRGNQDQGANASNFGDQAAGNQGAGGFTDYKNQAETDRLAAEAAKKAGCLPKLFTLLLPFVALAAYLVVRS